MKKNCDNCKNPRNTKEGCDVRIPRVKGEVCPFWYNPQESAEKKSYDNCKYDESEYFVAKKICRDCDTKLSKWQPIEQPKESAEKTLEEAAEKFFRVDERSDFDSLDQRIMEAFINGAKWQQQQTSAIDWKELRDKFFNECTDAKYHPDSFVRVNMVAHNLFEWMKKEINQYLKL